ncbi:ty3-gypsy retrotransposon protein [Tanacetum coccineum]
MVDGVQTQARNTDEQISKLSEDVKQLATIVQSQTQTLASQTETLANTLAAYDSIQESLNTQQKVLADMMVQFARLEKQAPLLLLPPHGNPLFKPHINSSTTGPVTSPLTSPLVTDNPHSHAKTPKLEIPLFSGDLVLEWLFQIKRFFEYYRTPTSNKLQIASFYMTGGALQWFHWMYQTHQLSTWEAFSHALEVRFGKSSFVNYEADLFKLKQTTSFTAYLTEFEILSTRTPGLTPMNLLNCFLSGLRDDIKRELYLMRPTSLSTAIGMAKLVDDKLAAERTSNRTHRSLSDFPPLPLRAPQQNQSTNRSNPLPLKRLTPAEMADRRGKGICFNYDEKFVPGCKPPLFLCLLSNSEASASCPFEDSHVLLLTEPSVLSEPFETPQISLHALTGQFVPMTLKIPGLLKKHHITVLIDGGSTHNFIQSRLVSFMGLTVQPSPHLRVTVGNGDSLNCGGFCAQSTLVMGQHDFTMDLLILPLYGADIVLGVQWLATLGPTLFDYKNLWMEFDYGGYRVKLDGIKKFLDNPTPHKQFASSLASLNLPVDLHNLLVSFEDVFLTPRGLPPSRELDHHIHLLPDCAPVNVRPYRYPHFQKSEIERLTAEMLDQGIIQPSLLVKKKDGTWRFCVDYRALNAVTVKDRFPIPTVDELLDELHGAAIFSKLDLRSGYHQVRLSREDIVKTAFRTHDGHYEFVVMPFGLTNAPSTFQALMTSIFRPFLRKYVLVFFDDILIYSSDWQTHLHHLHSVLDLLRQHTLHAKLGKCDFGTTTLTYLGHIVSSQGVAVDPEKISSIQDWPLPQNLKQLRGFLGLAGYYRRLKEALMNTPVLALPDFNKPFIIQTDASGIGVGAVLLQDGHPIAYFSRPLSSKLQLSSAYDREMFSITEAIQKWRQYLLGHSFSVQTDHQSLRTMVNQVLQTPSQQRWLAKLLGYDFSITYKSGRDNIAADALSRLPSSACTHLMISMHSFSTPMVALLDALRSFLKTHEGSSHLVEYILATPTDFPLYRISNGLVLYKDRILVPLEYAFHQLILAEYHNSSVGGHAGMQRTLARVSSTFYWPKIREMVREYVAQCTICQATKPFTTAPQGLLQPLPILGQIWESISMDFITHLPASSSKTTILVVVDYLSKHAHFAALGSSFTAVQVASVFVKEIMRLHGPPTTIFSNRDPIFMSSFWQELFRLQGTFLATSSAYHPQTDGQTEVLNRCLEDYLRSIRMTPFEAIYGRSPPSLKDYLTGTSPVATLDDLLSTCTHLLDQLKSKLLKAQLRMKNLADMHRTAVEFKEDDWVFVKLQPYRQSTLDHRKSNKLARRFYGPFQILARVGSVAYRLDLPDTAKVHNVFHVSLLKKCVGDPKAIVASLPSEFFGAHPILLPDRVVDSRTILQNGRSIQQVLVQWQNQPIIDATWENLEFRHDFPSFNLEVKVSPDEWAMI